jgi:hypothetical protein
MGKIVPSYWMALEFEITMWKSFRKALFDDEEKNTFDEIMDMARIMAKAAGNACKPILFEPLVMSIVLGQQKRIGKLERELCALRVP